jgi:hypothetical protein
MESVGVLRPENTEAMAIILDVVANLWLVQTPKIIVVVFRQWRPVFLL